MMRMETFPYHFFCQRFSATNRFHSLLSEYSKSEHSSTLHSGQTRNVYETPGFLCLETCICANVYEKDVRMNPGYKKYIEEPNFTT